MKILIAGGTGFIGNTIMEHLTLNTDIEYHILTRNHKENHDNVHYHLWDGRSMGSWKVYIDYCDVLINLAGKSVKCRYSQANKNAIYNSRIESTYILGEAVANSKNPPILWINTSTATIYRDERVRANDEYNGIIGEGFSVDVARKWEETFYASYTPFTRKVNMRAAIVFGRKAEVFKIYQDHINMYLSGRHGRGDQKVSWIHELDFVKAVKHFIENENSEGNYNIAAPNITDDVHFLRTFRHLMGKKVGLPVPEWALEIGAYICGAETEMLLKSRWVFPKRLREEGFEFQFPKHEEALRELLSSDNRKTTKAEIEKIVELMN
jgi:uncharacterized protein (TIGR01777 family)